MKKIIITTIAGIILATVITGCGKDTEKTSKEEHSNVNTWENNNKIIRW